MEILGLNELRERYLRFFESKNHLRVPSFSLVPLNDPSLLLINSGMAPLKPYFTGAQIPPNNRMTTCQKCIRTPDIENVGITSRHGTFFEMLGNFSFGDYFKKEAIAWAWEFVTEDLKLPLDRLWVSIYQDDDEAFEIWNKDIKLHPERIVRLGKKDNFWEHGLGPCGPCSEIYFDRGADQGCGNADCAVGCECDRFVEFWNLVFTQFSKDEAGNYSKLESTNIDTGMGIERLACVMQGVNSIFEVDTIRNILQYVCKLTNKEYGKTHTDDISIRIITDHIRSTTMMVCDGVIPQNEGRGYVLRRLLRRASRHGKLLGHQGNFLHDVARIVIQESKDAYPELAEKEIYIRKVIRIEEEKFQDTIDQGLSILNQYIEDVRTHGQTILSGEMIFKLHDTYGFPLDLTREIVLEQGLEVDENGFKEKMKEQRNTAREALMKNKGNDAWSDGGTLRLENVEATIFVGYESLETNSKIVAIIKDGVEVATAQEGDSVTFILDSSPFYAESGGQIGDMGIIKNSNVECNVENTLKTHDGKYLHIGAIQRGLLEKNDSVMALVDSKNRTQTAANHSTTHILHKTLKTILGDHVNQAGSLVDSKRLRFDFTHFSALTSDEMEKVEKIVNQKILENLLIKTKEMTIDEARKVGATALFGEKYGDVVRVVTVGDFSTELCGGTHLQSSSQAGIFKIVSEGAVASGVRRIEAITGESALNYFLAKEELVNEVCASLKTSPQDLICKVRSLSEEMRKLEKEMEKIKSNMVSGDLDKYIEDAKEIKGVKIAVGRLDQLDVEALRNASDVMKNKMGSGVVVLGSTFEDKVTFIVTATKDIVAKGVHSGNIVKEVAKLAGGSGGGRPDMAQAGGKDVSQVDVALKESYKLLEAQIK